MQDLSCSRFIGCPSGRESCTRQYCWHTRHSDQRLRPTWPICFNHRHRHGRCGRLVPLCWVCRGHQQFWRLVRFLWRHPPFGTLCRAMFDCLVLPLHTLLTRNWKLLCSLLHTYSVTWRQHLCILGRYGAIEIVLLLLWLSGETPERVRSKSCSCSGFYDACVEWSELCTFNIVILVHPAGMD